MNKKFSTLVASLLLAGSFNAFAQTELTDAPLKKAAEKGDYVAVKFHSGSDATATWDGSWNMDVTPGVLGKATLVVKQNSVYAPKTTSEEWLVKEVKVNGAVAGYSLVNGEGQKLSFNLTKNDNKNITGGTFAPDGKGEVYIFKLEGDNDGQRKMYATIHGDKWYLTQGAECELSLTKSGTNMGVFELPAHAWTVSELNNIVKDGFGLQFFYQDKDDKFHEYPSIKGNPFMGVLKAEGTNKEVLSDTTVKLYNEDGKQIVLTKYEWGSIGGGTTQTGYQFEAVTQREKAAIKAADKLYAEEFTITSKSLAGTEPLEVIAVKDNSNNLEFVVTSIEDVNRLTAATNKTVNYAEYTKANSTETSPQNTWIKFGVSNQIDYSVFYDKVWNITSGNFAAAPACNAKSDFVPATEVELSVPEGQWLYIGNQTFKNRESGVTRQFSGLRSTDESNVYAYATAPNEEKTLTITEAGTPGESEAGYFAGYSADQLKQKAFNIGTVIASTGDTVYMKNAGEKIEWTKDVADAIQFRFTKVIFNNGDKLKTDVIKHYTDYLGLNKDEEAVVKYDIINLYRYNLTESVSGLRLAYDKTNQVYKLTTPVADEDYESLDRFSTAYTTVVLKSKGADNYNILTGIKGDNVSYIAKGSDLAEVDGKAKFAQWNLAQKAFCNSEKLYGAHNSNALVQADAAYNNVENDIFVIKDADNYMYRAAAAMDTIKIFRNVDNNYVMYETGTLLADAKGEAIEGFLGIQNFLDPKFAEKNPALLVDTAAGYGSWRPEYMLAVDATVEADGWTCPLNPEHNTAEWREEHGGHCADAIKDRPYVTGRYLVNLVDSAEVAKREDCVFQNFDGTKYYRLGFVQATHLGDSLIIASTKDSINLLDNTVDKVCTFAFRYVDEARDAFRIETAYIYSVDEDNIATSKRGWIKFHNGIPVVTPHVTDAEVFDLEVLENQNPTANEEVAVSEVSVVAVDGAVVVKGAAGKAVAISNILGQTIANTVIASDNETIAVPAGIVVVAVEGEEAVKAIVK